MFEQLILIKSVYILVREFLVEHPIESEAERVDITFVGILFLEDELRSRCAQSSNDFMVMQFFSAFEELLTESKVANLDNIVMDKDIGWLDVSVDDVVPSCYGVSTYRDLQRHAAAV